MFRLIREHTKPNFFASFHFRFNPPSIFYHFCALNGLYQGVVSPVFFYTFLVDRLKFFIDSSPYFADKLEFIIDFRLFFAPSGWIVLDSLYIYFYRGTHLKTPVVIRCDIQALFALFNGRGQVSGRVRFVCCRMSVANIFLSLGSSSFSTHKDVFRFGIYQRSMKGNWGFDRERKWWFKRSWTNDRGSMRS